MYELHLNDPNFLPHVGCAVSFSLHNGAGLILSGENGLGKTTLMHRFSSQLGAQIPSSLISQSPLGFFYDRKLETFRRLFLETCGARLDLTLFDKLWAEFGLSGKDEHLLSELSGGEQQLLKLICGLSKVADIYLLDEPSHSLDQEKKKILSQLLQDFLKNKKSILMIEHDLNWTGGPWEVVELKVLSGSIQESRRWNI